MAVRSQTGTPAERPGVILQNLRDFTVQIRRPDDDAIVGTGVVVSMDGAVVTCAHVVEAALKTHPRQADGAEVGVYFPQARGGETKDRRARVAGCFPQHDDDVVLLQLSGGPAPLGPEQIAVLGSAEASCFHPFRSYGYRRLADYLAGHAHGTIMDCVEAPPERQVQAEPVQLESSQINQGMSGAAVLDVERNLVVGLVSETWFPDRSGKDRDTAWAVNARVLTFDPLNLPLREADLPKRPAPPLRTDVEAARRAVPPGLGAAWNNAPAPIPEWVGRADMLAALDRDWADPERRVTGLIGFGGEGKSSLARQWVEGALAGGDRPQGLFWWGFYERPSVDEFFEAALVFMGGGRVDPRRLPSASLRAQVIGAMLGAGRYLFVLDGLEVLQHQQGDDDYGLLRSADLRAFLGHFAAPGHRSFCLVTSRAPLLDLMAYTSYAHRDVNRLSPADGRALLREVGVRGEGAALDRVVAQWDGHALTLSLLGAYLVDRHGGEVARIDELPPPTAGEPRYQRVHRVLRRYDEHLSPAGRAFLTLFSAFRTPVAPDAFERVFRADVGGGPPRSPLQETLAALDQAEFERLVERLCRYRLLRHDPREDHYTAHPLVRAHYFARLSRGEPQAAHAQIKDYYLAVAGDTPHHPSLDDLAPLIEVVHHACRAGAYDEAERIRWERIDQRNRHVLVWQLGAYETALALRSEFFPDGDTTQDPLVSDPKDKSWLLNGIGFCLMSLGRLARAAPFYQRCNAIKLELEDWHNASLGYQNLASLHVYLGELAAAGEAAGRSLELARRAENQRDERTSLAWAAWIAHLGGDLAAAGDLFRQAEALEREVDSAKRYLYSLRGIQHAEHLRRAGQSGEPVEPSGQALAYARRVTEANLEICQRNRWANQISWCHRVLGDLDAGSSTGSERGGDHESARAHYEQALKIARSITYRPALIEALLARGRWRARRGLAGASSDLEEALGYALEGGYRVYEADTRVGLAWAQRAAGNLDAARTEAQRALALSRDLGYHWGGVDAAEALAAIESQA